MRRLRPRIIYIIMIAVAIIYILSVAYIYIDTHYINTETYMMQSAPWYIGAEINAIPTAIIEIVLFIISKLTKGDNIEN